MSATTKRAELKKLANQLRENIWKMLRIADQLLRDTKYVDTFGGEPQLMEHLQENEFAHFGGSPSVSQLIKAYRANPEEDTWSEYKYNVWAMIDLSQPPKEERETAARTDWKTVAMELQVKCEQLQAALDSANERVTELSKRLGDANHRCAVMEGRLQELEKSLQRV